MFRQLRQATVPVQTDLLVHMQATLLPIVAARPTLLATHTCQRICIRLRSCQWKVRSRFSRSSAYRRVKNLDGRHHHHIPTLR